MDIANIFNDLVMNKELLVKTGLLIYCNYVLVNKIKNRKKHVNNREVIEDSKIYEIDQAILQAKQELNAAINQKNKTKYLIKVKPKIQHSRMMLQDSIRSNQIYYVEPSYNNIANKVTQMVNKLQTGKKIKNSEKEKLVYAQKWKVLIDSDKLIKNKQYIIEGYGQIVDSEIFTVNSFYTPIKNKGIVKNIYELITYFLEAFLFYNQTSPDTIEGYRLSKNQNRSPFFKGPVVGTITYLMNFVVNQTVLLQATIQNGKIHPILLSSSKQPMLQFFTNKIIKSNFEILILSALNVIMYRLVYKVYKRKIKQWFQKAVDYFIPKKVAGKRLKVYKNSSDQLGDDKLCIICFTNCRNTILFNCRHLILCDSCKSVYNKQQCPLCKAYIQEDKTLVC